MSNSSIPKSDSSKHCGPKVLYSCKAIHELVFKCADSHPDRIALRCGQVQLSYRKLLARASAYAGKLRTLDLKPGEVIAIGLPRSMDLVATMLGVLMTRAAYCILDPRWPQNRVQKVLRDVRAAALVTNSNGSWQVNVEEKERMAESHYELGDVVLDLPFCVYHTSGTTGTPKAVVTSHRGILRTLLAPEYPSIRYQLSMGCAAALAWDIFTLEVWFPLINGGTCVLIDELTPDILRTSDLTTLWLTGSRFNVLVEEDIECLQNLKELLIGGERLSVFHVRTFVERFPGVNLVNGYGPAEANILTTTHLIQLSDCLKSDGIPLGRPMPGTEIQLISRASDNSLYLTPSDEQGEIAIAGDALALGYTKNSVDPSFISPFVQMAMGNDKNTQLRRFYLTGDFGYWDTDGNLAYCNRRDGQIKLHGQRIDPFEIEQAMLNVGSITQCVVTAQQQSSASLVLVAHVVPSENYIRDGFRARLSMVLPSYQIPSVIVEIVQLPLSATGKVDRQHSCLSISQNILELSSGKVSSQQAATLDSQDLCAGKVASLILEASLEVIGIEELSLDDDLISKGMDSLGAFRVACRMSKMMPSSPILASDILLERSPNRAALRCLERRGSHQSVDSRHESIPRYEIEWASHWLQTQWFTGMVLPRRAEACINGFAYRFSGPITVASFRGVFESIMQRHDILRTTVRVDEKSGSFVSSLIPMSEALLTMEKLVNREMLTPNEIQQHVASTMRRVNIAKGPIVAIHLIAEPNGVCMLIGVHHATFDGQSEAILMKEINAGLLGQSLPHTIQFKDTLSSTAGDIPPDAWSKRLASSPAIHWPDLSTKATESYGCIPIELPLHQMTGSNASDLETRFMLALRCFATAIRNTIGRPFRLSYTDNGRYDGDLAATLGNYVRLPPMPMDDEVFQDIVKEGAKMWAEAFDRRDMSVLSQTAQCAAEPEYQGPLLQVLIVWQNVELPTWTIPAVEVRSLPVEPLAPMFDMTLELWPFNECIQGCLEFDPAVMTRATAAKVLDDFTAYFCR